jgi:hypothetical protein
MRGLPGEDCLDLDEYWDFEAQDHYDYLVPASAMSVVPVLADTQIIRPCVF